MTTNEMAKKRARLQGTTAPMVNVKTCATCGDTACRIGMARMYGSLGAAKCSSWRPVEMFQRGLESFTRLSAPRAAAIERGEYMEYANCG